MKTTSQETRSPAVWMTLLIGLLAIGAGTVSGCAEQQPTSQSADSTAQEDASSHEGIVSMSFASQKEVKEAFDRYNVSSEALAIRVRKADDFEIGAYPHMLKIGGLAMSRYALNNGDRVAIFVCEACRRADLKPGSEVLLGEKGDGDEFLYGTGTPTGYIYNGTSFVVESHNR